jgi:DNA-binding NarL/FixJ family response regulator
MGRRKQWQDVELNRMLTDTHAVVTAPSPADTAIQRHMRVVFASDCGLYLSGLVRELASLEWVETHLGSSISEVEHLIGTINVDVIGLDERATTLRDGIFELLQRSPYPPKILVLNSGDHLSAEASGQVLRGAGAQEIASALLLVKAGYRILPTGKVAPLAAAGRLTDPLVTEELNILRLLATGTKQAVIAKRLSQSEASLKRRIRSINEKLGVGRSAEAIAVGIRLNLI